MNSKNRITYLDMAKGAGIILMITGHLTGSLQAIDFKPYFSPLYQFIASFTLPEQCWTENYFIPREAAINRLSKKYARNETMI